MKRSFSNPSITPNSRLLRAAVLGMVYCERARAAKTTGYQDSQATAMLSRALMKPFHDRLRDDIDLVADLAIRYGDACALSGDYQAAPAVFRSADRRYSVLRGPETPAARLARRRLTELAAVQRSDTHTTSDH